MHFTLCSSSLIVIITVAFQPLHPFLSSIYHAANVNEESAVKESRLLGRREKMYSTINNKQVFTLVAPRERAALIQGGPVFNHVQPYPTK